MPTLLRHLAAILALPVIVTVVVPALLLSAPSDSRWPADTAWAWLARGAGAASLAIGACLFGWCVVLFARVGRGTLAPWDPTRELVAVGPYRSMRNPMITGVALMLTGQALWWGSWRVAVWTGAFVLINHIYFVFSEEPGLRRRFGEPYELYTARVPRWIPHLRRTGGRSAS